MTLCDCITYACSKHDLTWVYNLYTWPSVTIQPLHVVYLALLEYTTSTRSILEYTTFTHDPPWLYNLYTQYTRIYNLYTWPSVTLQPLHAVYLNIQPLHMTLRDYTTSTRSIRGYTTYTHSLMDRPLFVYHHSLFLIYFPSVWYPKNTPVEKRTWVLGVLYWPLIVPLAPIPALHWRLNVKVDSHYSVLNQREPASGK